MLAEEEDSERIISIIRNCIGTGDIQNFVDTFDATSSRYVDVYQKKVKKESEKKAHGGGRKKAKKDNNSEDLLLQMIQNNERRRAGGPDSIFGDILAKYSSTGGKKTKGKKQKDIDVYENISEDSFEAAQARLNLKKRKS